MLPSLGRARAWAALAGATLVLAGFVLIRPGMPFPFPAALLPCIGCALLLACGEAAPTARLLAMAPVRALGLVSYSLYLWHWPVMAFYRLETGVELDAVEVTGLILASLLLAVFSYRLVEQPFRDRFRNAPPLRVLAASAAAVLLVGGAAAVTVLWPGSWRNATPEQARIAAYWDYYDWPVFQYQFRPDPCFIGPADPFHFDPSRCLALDPERPNLLVVGDSHAAQYWRAIALRHPRLNVLQATASGCHPFVDAAGADTCVEVMRHAFGPILRSGEVDTVILAARWIEADIPQIGRTIAEIRRHGTDVIVLGPTVEYHGVFPALLARALAHGDPEMTRIHLVEARFALDRRLEAEARAAGARYVSVTDILCPDGACRLTAPDGSPMQFDYGHLTLPAARWVVERMPAFGR